MKDLTRFDSRFCRMNCQMTVSRLTDARASRSRELSLWPEFSLISGNLCGLSKGYFAATFLSSNLTCPANQSGSVGYVRVTGFGVVGRALACRDEFPTKMRGEGNSTSSQLVKEDVNLNLRYHVMTIGSGNDQWEASLECDGGSGGCEDPRAGFGLTQEEAEAAVLTVNEKRAILASWASDACAMQAVPTLRRLPGGKRPVHFDEVMDALRALWCACAQPAKSWDLHCRWRRLPPFRGTGRNNNSADLVGL